MPPRTARTLGIVLAVLGLVAVIVAIVLLVRPADGAGAPTSTPVAPSASAAAAPSTAPTEAESTETATEPTATDAPTETFPTETSPTEGVVASPAPGAAATAAAVLSFTASPATIDCAGDRTASVPVALSWQTEGGVAARLAVGTTDARAGDPVDLSATGYSALSVPCRDAETLITLAVESPDGTLTQRTLVLPTSE
ncbi:MULTISPECIES: hypothetical protein [unclassified Rathayibacter]|uniref:hypothetical protein n=1 Tax=unclassified Rathayibacter TaxID=2609250 RepID=UPI0010526C89|nr:MULTISPECIES: hypothetical protein [unclassified Rathayibacter]MCJ1702991.1 hypothetical protein [Rathayibacter sp. VKM Ac-2926]TCL81836.1 hypothetical protein EDF49_107197 [Rathayibacter sp. PhB192]TCM26845.1 hypothetical protein EDF43_107197 [Rathayibacter sp. PhB179]